MPSLAEKFPRGFPPEDHYGLGFVREVISMDSEETTAERLMTGIYNLIFWKKENPIFHFEEDQDAGIVHPRYEEETEFGIMVGGPDLKSAYMYFASKRNQDGTLSERHRPVIGMYVEFRFPIPESNVWTNVVYAASIRNAVVYVAPELGDKARRALAVRNKLRKGEGPVNLQEEL